MPKLTIVNRSGEETTIDAKVGWTVMENIRAVGFRDIFAICGGCASCGTCHIFVDEAWLPHLAPIKDDEELLLDCAVERRPTSRLSCQIKFVEALDGGRVTIAPEII